jgi:Tfp pilus assembly protein FimT
VDRPSKRADFTNMHRAGARVVASRDFEPQTGFERAPRAFTLVELLIIISIIGILVALITPQFALTAQEGRVNTLATTVQHARELIEYNAATRAVPLSAGGYPLAIDPDWFVNGKLPAHTWTEKPMVVKTEAGAANAIYPAVKTFNLATPGAVNAWYNTTNGSFCALVPPSVTDAETLANFNAVNVCDASSLNQTTK